MWHRAEIELDLVDAQLEKAYEDSPERNHCKKEKKK